MTTELNKQVENWSRMAYRLMSWLEFTTKKVSAVMAMKRDQPANLITPIVEKNTDRKKSTTTKKEGEKAPWMNDLDHTAEEMDPDSSTETAEEMDPGSSTDRRTRRVTTADKLTQVVDNLGETQRQQMALNQVTISLLMQATGVTENGNTPNSGQIVPAAASSGPMGMDHRDTEGNF